MRRLFAVISLLMILVGCSSTPTQVTPTLSETPRPTVTPLGKGNGDSNAPPLVVVTRQVMVTRLALITATPLPTAISDPTLAPQPTALPIPQGTPIEQIPVIVNPPPALPTVPLLTPTTFPVPTSPPAPTAIPSLTPTPPAPTLAPLPTSTPTPVASYGGPWIFAGSMTISRGWHSATVLHNGWVLIVGGSSALDQDTAGVEVFYPGSNTFMPVPSLNTARHSHTATLLPDGRVLVIAGYALGWLSSAEIYNPINGQWSMTQPLFSHGVCHSATLLQDERVLVMAGAKQSGFSGPDDRVEIFDPATNRWQAAVYHANTEGCHTATRLRDGRVLIAGGNADPGIYDPIMNAWLPTGRLAFARNEAQAALLPNGRVLLAGGTDSQRTTVYASAEIYDPSSNTWQLTTPMSQPRYEHTATLLPDGRVLAVGGYRLIDGYEAALLNTAEIYDYRTGKWSSIAPLHMGRSQHTTTLLPDGRVLVAGGETSRGTFLGSAEILRP